MNALFAVLVLAAVGFFAYRMIRSRAASKDAHAWVEAGAKLVDVRSREEFAGSHLPGAANIPVDELERRVAEVGKPDTKVVVYCASGMRSARAARVLRAAGYAEVLDLGAMSSW